MPQWLENTQKIKRRLHTDQSLTASKTLEIINTKHTKGNICWNSTPSPAWTCCSPARQQQSRRLLFCHCTAPSDPVNNAAASQQPTSIISIVRSFVIAGRGPAYSAPQRGDHREVQCACLGERRGSGWCVRVCAWRAGWGGLSRCEQLVRYLYRRAPPQGVAYCLARPGWDFFSDSPLVLLQC